MCVSSAAALGFDVLAPLADDNMTALVSEKHPRILMSLNAPSHSDDVTRGFVTTTNMSRSLKMKQDDETDVKQLQRQRQEKQTV